MSDPALAASAEPCMVSLIPVLDLQAAEPLRAELMSLRGRPLEIDASQVARLGGLCLQVLMSARKIWSEDGVTLTVNQPSLAFSEQLTAFGNPELHCEPEGGLS
ncbi:MAG TPA: STAS domain-containing protein [Phenylobacterium sp.]|nr:STAS domain-containing protein [Phenylobacterium sp.]